MSAPLQTSYRTDVPGELRVGDAGRSVRLVGWVHKRRDLGGLVFLDLRDRSGRVQLSCGPDWSSPATMAAAASVSAEWVIAVEGVVHPRPEGMANRGLVTGEIEVRVDALRVLAESATPPIPVARGADDELPAEELRLRYRYL